MARYAAEESIAFYGDVLGWTTVRSEDDDPPYYEWQNGDHTVGGLAPMVGDDTPADVPNHWRVYFAVADTDASAALATELGGVVVVPPSDIPTVGRFALLNDPQGASFAIISLLDAALVG